MTPQVTPIFLIGRMCRRSLLRLYQNATPV